MAELGSPEGALEARRRHLLALFPRLTGFTITSPPSIEYNCFAWAAQITTAWWSPDPGYYWPVSIDGPALDVVLRGYESLGFERCDDGALERGYEKITLYLRDGEPIHAARQLPSGRWSSKLGRLEDIEHATVEELLGSGFAYGDATLFLRRPLPE